MRRIAASLVLVLAFGLAESHAQSHNGLWRGTTSQGQVFSFTVLNQSVVETDFRFVTSDSTTATLTGNVTPALPVASGTFSGPSGVCYALSGTFTSATTASGGASVTDDPACATLRALGFTWNASLVIAPENDNVSSSVLLNPMQGTARGSNVKATLEAGEPPHSETAGAGSSVWWKWIAPQTGTATFDTAGSDFDTVLAVYEGASLGALKAVVASDDYGDAMTSRVTFAAVGGSTYSVAVAGMLGQTGSIQLNWATPLTISRSFSLPEKGALVLSTGGTGQRTGSVAIEPSGGNLMPAAMEIISLRQNGVLVSEAGVPAAAAILNGRTYVEIGGHVNTAVAFVNPGLVQVDLNFSARDINGALVASGTVRIPANGQVVGFLTEAPFSIPVLDTGTLTFAASAPVAALVIRVLSNERHEALMTAIPVLDLASPPASLPPALPYFVDGGGWNTQMILINPTDLPVSGALRLSDMGSSLAPPNPVIVTTDGGRSDTFRFSIAPGGAWRLRTSGGATSPVAGSATILPDAGSQPPMSIAIVSSQVAGTTVAETALSPGAAVSTLRMYAESAGEWGQAGSVRSAIAISNLSLSPTSVNFELTDSNGAVLGTASLMLAGGAAFAGLINQIPGLEGLPAAFTGTLKISTVANGSVVAVGLRCRYNERQDLLVTATNPAPETRPGSARAAYFPYFADGNGFATQFILFGTTVNQGTAGSMWFFDPAGQSIAPPLQ